MKEYLVTTDDGREFYVPSWSAGHACAYVQQILLGRIPLVQIHAHATGRRI